MFHLERVSVASGVVDKFFTEDRRGVVISSRWSFAVHKPALMVTRKSFGYEGGRWHRVGANVAAVLDTVVREGEGH